MYARSVRALVLALLVVATTAALGPVARAQGPSPTPHDRAVSLFADSVAAYREGRFDDAATLLEQAYALTPEPILLYNLGRAREGAGDDDAAADAYRRYLATEGTDPSDASAARARLAVLDRRIEERHRLEALAAEREAETEPAPTTAPPPPPAREIAIAPWIVAGAGALGLIVGGVLGGMMLDRSSAAQAAPVQLDAATLHDEAVSYAIGADVAFAVGGIALGVGVIWGLVDVLTASSPAPSRESARLRLAPTGLEVTW